jgi:hypothetical protein
LKNGKSILKIKKITIVTKPIISTKDNNKTKNEKFQNKSQTKA